ncbi:MAG: TetR/AcrR family transcriptional regulator [Candidatus Cloacimonetes bacterium]|nr:TetR/AcrR family transcriptional regulator [Candidatus Cloacimonadota bacterium]
MNKAKDKKKLIIDTADGLFSRYGFSKTSLDDISSTAQIAKGTVYHYFPSKEDLFVNVIQNKAEAYFAMLQEHLDKVVGFENKLSELLHIPIKFIYEQMPVLIEGLKNLPFNYQERLMEFRTQLRIRMKELIGSILATGYHENLINVNIAPEKLCEVMADWFLLGDANVQIIDMKKMLERVEADHEILIQILLYGIVKRGNK